MRLGEIIGLSKRDIDFDRGRIVILEVAGVEERVAQFESEPFLPSPLVVARDGVEPFGPLVDAPDALVPLLSALSGRRRLYIVEGLALFALLGAWFLRHVDVFDGCVLFLQSVLDT